MHGRPSRSTFTVHDQFEGLLRRALSPARDLRFLLQIDHSNSSLVAAERLRSCAFKYYCLRSSSMANMAPQHSTPLVPISGNLLPWVKWDSSLFHIPFHGCSSHFSVLSSIAQFWGICPCPFGVYVLPSLADEWLSEPQRWQPVRYAAPQREGSNPAT